MTTPRYVQTNDACHYDLADLRPTKTGGEAEIYVVPGDPGHDGAEFVVLKLYKGPDHPDFDPATAYSPAEQYRRQQAREDAARRLERYPEKIGDFPRHTPPSVVRPTALAYVNSRFAGIKMPYVPDARTLYSLLSPSQRQDDNTDPNFVHSVMRTVRDEFSAVHGAGMRVGDVSSTNILVLPDGTIRLVDADAMTYGKYRACGYTPPLNDPLRLNAAGQMWTMASDHSDWYGFTAMLVQATFMVGLYDGSCEDLQVPPELELITRQQRRMTVFDRRVVLPPVQIAVPFTAVPAPVVDYILRVVEHDVREEFPPYLLDFTWRKCARCDQYHARSRCPFCSPHAVSLLVRRERSTTWPRPRPQKAKNSIELSLQSGEVVAVREHKGKPRILFVEDGSLYLGNRSTCVTSKLPEPPCRFDLCGDTPVVGAGERLAVVWPEGAQGYYTSAVGNVPAFACNNEALFLMNGLRLAYVRRALPDHAVLMGPTLPSTRSLLWAGEQVGFALSDTPRGPAGTVFDTRGALRINASLQFPELSGGVGETACYIGEHTIWLLVRDAPSKSVHVFSIDPANGDYQYDLCNLSSPAGFAAYGDALCVVEGRDIVRYAFAGQRFTETGRMVGALPQSVKHAQLVVSGTAGYAVGGHEVHRFELAA